MSRSRALQTAVCVWVLLPGCFSGGNRPPRAIDDVAETAELTPVVIDVMANDFDPDGDPIAVRSVGPYPFGPATLEDDGTVTYEPPPGLVGVGRFTYVISDDDGYEDTGTVTVTVASGPAVDLFPRPQTYCVGPDPCSLAVGDLNGDGRADLAAACFGSWL